MNPCPQPTPIARAILDGFNRHYCLFQAITQGAQDRFEQADWLGVQAASRERIHYYDLRVTETIGLLREAFGIASLEETLWQRIKLEYVGLLHAHQQPELAETFYNSVFCGLFDRRYYNNRNIFVRPAVSTEHMEADAPAYRSYYPARGGFYRSIDRILDDCGFGLPFPNRRSDIRNILHMVRGHFPPAALRHQNFQLAVLSTPFFRNKGAYVIGKAVNGAEEIPFVVPILNDEQGGLYVDSLLLGEEELANVFSFARAYFMVDTPVPSAVVDFLLRLLPRHSKADLYTAIGLQKHGKTEFYRDFLHHLRHSSDAFITAPGIRGMVMSVFTLPSYPWVFKIIKDRFPPPKDLTRKQVKQKYLLVKQHDRVGRMADSLEYSHAAFPLNRFHPELLTELQRDSGDSLRIEDGQLIIRHLYIERRMTPLNIYLRTADTEKRRRAISGYGRALRQLAAANIFAGDLLFKNFGVTRQGRVVFYDYDEICYLTECNFRKIPEPPYPEFELSGEPWYSVGPQDVFPEEFASFLLTDPEIRRLFLELNGDLLEADFWRQKQDSIRAGRFEDVFPYSLHRRFPPARPPRIPTRNAA